MFRFESPMLLWLLLLLPLLALWRWRLSRRPSLRFSSVAGLAQAGGGWRARLAWIPDGLRLLALALVVVALARPQFGFEKVREIREGVALEMVLDRSPSMQTPMAYGTISTRSTRLDVVKRVFEKFIFGDGGKLKGRPDDLVGIVTFSGFADTICPLTFSHEVFRGYLKTVTFPVTEMEQGTAIGDAVALAAARLQKVEAQLVRERKQAVDAYRIRSKVLVLLSDGSNNRGKISPAAAAALAKSWGVKIYAIGIGNPEDARDRDPFTSLFRGSPVYDMDEAAMRSLAAATGGRYWLARDGNALEEICAEIDKLEKTSLETTRQVDYKEQFAVLAWSALALLLLEILLRQTLFRRLP